MKMVRYNPSNLFDDLQKEFLNSLAWSNSQDKSCVETSEWVPSIDIVEDAETFTVIADIPGVDPKKIDINMENHVLTIKGERENLVNAESAKLTRCERSKGSFYRQFTLPETAAADKISAVSKHGVLEITIPKQEVAKPRAIQIKVQS